ncbi:MAG: hypothetical protein ABI185_11270 [Ginsengibacter sp.]
MKFKKIIFKNGDNNLYDYFVLVEKSKIELDKDNLAYKFDTSNNISFVLNHENIQSNFDFILEKKTKSGDVKGIELCNYEDIEWI